MSKFFPAHPEEAAAAADLSEAKLIDLIETMLERRAESREYVDAICEAREQEKKETTKPEEKS
jgi:hypothetical protein